MAEPRMQNGEGQVTASQERAGGPTIYRAEPPPAVWERPMAGAQARIERVTPVTPARDRIRWGPVIAGLVTTIAAMSLLTVLGLAIGLSVFDPASRGRDVGVAATIWSALSALLAFFLGGWVTGRTAALQKDELAALNGFMVGATALALILWLTSTGLGNLFGGIGANVADIARVGTEQGVGRTDVTNAAQNAGQTVRDAAVQSYDQARNSAWGTFFGLSLALAAAALGGLLGHRSKDNRITLWGTPRLRYAGGTDPRYAMRESATRYDGDTGARYERGAAPRYGDTPRYERSAGPGYDDARYTEQ